MRIQVESAVIYVVGKIIRTLLHLRKKRRELDA